MKLRWFNKEKEEPKQQIEIEKIIPDPISLQMLMVMEQAIKSIQQVPEEMQYPVKDYSTVTPPEIQRLINMGFENVEKVRKYRKELEAKGIEYERKRSEVRDFNKKRKDIIAKNEKLFEKFRFLLKARQTYGKDTLLLPYSAFFDILKRNDLACGLFKDYLGEIPDDKLQEIQNLISISPLEEIETLYKIKYFWFSAADEYWKKSIELFPFHFGKEKKMEEYFDKKIGLVKRPSKNYLYKVLYNGTYVTTYDPYRESHLGYDETGTKFFIVAPGHLIKDRAIVREAPNPDPLICAFTKYGIIVTVRWGEEANDEVIQRFEAFNNNLERLGL